MRAETALENGGPVVSRPYAKGFSAHVGEPIAPTDKLRVEDAAAYLVRNPLSLKKLVYLDGLSSPEAGKPPPPALEVLCATEHGDGWGSPQQWDPA